MVVSNARNVKVTGRKDEQKVYRHHTMYPGGLKEITYKTMMHRKPDEVSVVLCYSSYMLSARADHPSGSFRHVTQEQATREKTGTFTDIRRGRCRCVQA